MMAYQPRWYGQSVTHEKSVPRWSAFIIPLEFVVPELADTGGCVSYPAGCLVGS